MDHGSSWAVRRDGNSTADYRIPLKIVKKSVSTQKKCNEGKRYLLL